MINSKEISVVVQGAVDRVDLPICLSSIRNYLPAAEIILSTWEGSDVDELDYDKVVFSKDPGTISADRNDERYNNLNRELVGVQAGLQVCYRKYILKLRSDMLLINSNFLSFFERKYSKSKQYQIFVKRIVTVRLFTRHFIGRGNKHYRTPFHVSDWCNFGLTDDIKTFWTVPLVKEPNFSRHFENSEERLKYEYSTRTWKFPPEQYIFYTVVNKFFPNIVMKDLLDYDDQIIEFSENIISNNFIILNPANFGVDLKKYDCHREVTYEPICEGLYKETEFQLQESLLKKISKKICNKIYHKVRDGDKRIITLLGFKFSYKRRKADVNKIRLVEIEIYSFCNRKCWFCPNSFIDRQSNNILMDENIYLGVINELKSINYKGIISYSRYNEPLAYKDIFLKRLALARELVPMATLHTNTNGDYLNNRQYLDELYEAGLRSLNIQCYLNENQNFDIHFIKENVQKMAQKLELGYEVKAENQDRYEVAFLYKDMSLRMYARDFRVNGNNRGGSLDTIEPVKRAAPCFIPYTDIYIDYNGKVLPCCNLRSDNKDHRAFILGDVNKTSVLKIFNSKKMQKLRENLSHENIDFYPCNECNFAIGHKKP